MSEARCTKCGEVKPLTEFYVEARDGRRTDCKTCVRARTSRVHRTRRAVPGARLDESMRDTVRHQRHRLSHHIHEAEELYP